MNVRTRFVPGDVPLNEYPRPQLVRGAWQNLNGRWDYAVRPAGDGAPERWDGAILVPFCIESELSGVQRALHPGEALWYRRRFSVDGLDGGRRVLLHFGAVDERCRIWVNGCEAGGHTGGYLPFTLDITELVAAQENTLCVCVYDDTGAHGEAHGKQSLAPGGIWYTAVSGIWQTVWLEVVPQNHIRALAVTPSLTGLRIAADVCGEGELRVAVYDGDEAVASGAGRGEVCLSIPSPHLWSPEDPHLYRLAVAFGEDRVESYAALRTFGVGPDEHGVPRLLLNGRPYFQRGLLDQGYWPDGLYTAPTDEALCSDIQAAKALGFNMLRKHVKVEPARWYYHCDRLGMLVWQDMPNGGTRAMTFANVALPYLGVHVRDGDRRRFGREDEAVRRQFLDELRALVLALYSAPCICMWVPFNEGWGQFDSAGAAALVRELDATRPVDAASGWHDQGAGDLVSVHRYVLRLKAPRRRDARAFCLTEYGGYSCALPGHLWREAEGKKGFGYRMYKDEAALTRAWRALHARQVQPLISAGLSACIYTQLTDVEGEVNGLFTYDRAVCKLDAEAVRQENRALRLPQEP